MFKWDKKEFKLLKMSDNALQTLVIITSINSKISFINKMNNNELDIVLKAKEKINNDLYKGVLKIDKDNNIKTTSLKAWIKRNELQDIVDTYINGKYSTIGELKLLDCNRKIYSLDNKASGDEFNSYINELFYRQLKICKREEKKLFESKK